MDMRDDGDWWQGQGERHQKEQSLGGDSVRDWI